MSARQTRLLIHTVVVWMIREIKQVLVITVKTVRTYSSCDNCKNDLKPLEIQQEEGSLKGSILDGMYQW